jgi:hypothetical protein
MSSSIVYADSSIAIECARSSDLPGRPQIRTLSPALILGNDSDIVSAEESWRENGAESLARDAEVFCRDIYAVLSANPRFSPMAIAIAQLGITFPTTVRVAMSVRDEDYTNPVTVVQTRSGDDMTDRVQNIPWQDVLSENQNLRAIEVDTSEYEVPDRHRPESIGFLDRQRLGGWEKIGFQLIQKFWNKLPFNSPRGTFLLLRENPLLRETALYLSYRGYAIKSLSSPPPEEAEVSSKEIECLGHLLAPVVRSLLEPRLPGPAISCLMNIFLNEVKTTVARYRAGRDFWAKELDKRIAERPKAVLTNMQMTPETAALHNLCNERDLTLVSFQHGVAREVNQYNTYIQAYYEGNTSDRFYSFNPAAAEISNACPFNKSENVAVGFPALYLRTGTYRGRNKSAPPILYASTQLFSAAMNMAATRGCTDTEMATSELRLIDDVFAKLPHEILFKPYPERRFLDPDPVLEHIADIGNITTYEMGDDLRFLMANSEIVVTSRATSTLGWSVASRRPLVFIDYPRQLPLRPNVKAAMSKAFFLFDATEDDYLDKLRIFLSKPVAEIKDLWQQKSLHRESTINEYFGCDGWGAGRRAATDLLKHLSSR